MEADDDRVGRIALRVERAWAAGLVCSVVGAGAAALGTLLGAEGGVILALGLGMLAFLGTLALMKTLWLGPLMKRSAQALNTILREAGTEAADELKRLDDDPRHHFRRVLLQHIAGQRGGRA